MRLLNTVITFKDIIPPILERALQRIPVGRRRYHPFSMLPEAMDADWILDVGANVGKVSEAALRSFPRSHVVCFEPVQETFRRLKARLAGYGDRVTCINQALSNTNAKARINLTSFHGANSLHPQSGFHRFFNPHVTEIGTEEIALVRLDDVRASLPTQRFDLMKIDVEGHEAEVLEGGEQFIREAVDTVMVEISLMRDPSWTQQAVYHIFDLMNAMGFCLINAYDLHHSGHGEMMLVQMDCVFRKCKVLHNPPRQIP